MILALLAAVGGSMRDGSAAESRDAVSLAGPSAEIGALWGRINAPIIREDMQRSFIEPAARDGISEAELIARAERFVAIAREAAPHWLEEAEAIARAAGVDAALYQAYIGMVYRGLWQGHECTSYTVSSKYTRDAIPVFHKNRDNKDKPQAACIVATRLPGLNRFITVTDASVLACMMMVNEKGLAGSADTGGLRPRTPKHRGVMNTFILRHIAERAGTCGEALGIIRHFVEKGYYAGGGHTGTHWLFVDRSGAVLEVSNNEEQVVAHRHDDKQVYFSARGDTPAARALENAEEPIDFHLFHNVSRDPSVCFDSSISGMTVEISPAHPATLTCAWITFPARGVAFPLFMGGTQTPRPLLTGEVYGLSTHIANSRAAWEAVEASSHSSKEALVPEAESLLAEGREKAAKAMLDGWVAQTAGAQVNMLRSRRERAVARREQAAPATQKVSGAE